MFSVSLIVSRKHTITNWTIMPLYRWWI